MTYDELKQKALQLPMAPGVYIMRDENDNVIYVGKAKKLKNRVSQYFQDTATHTPKTRLMVSKIDHFDVIVAASEFEALVLECSLIKRYKPKYNILLKDDKGYPMIRVNTNEPYPQITVVGKAADDGAEYFGPYGSRSITQNIRSELLRALKLPTCSKQFPRDIGQGRVCLNYHINQCSGWCQNKKSHAEYLQAIANAKQLLLGNYKAVADDIRKRMLQAAEEMNFELAANLRDHLTAVESLGKKQTVTAGRRADVDVIGFVQAQNKACFSVLHYKDGALLDKDYEFIESPDDSVEAVSSLVKQYYLNCGIVPQIIILPFELEDQELFIPLFEKEYRKKIQLRVPKRGDFVRLLELANKNAFEELQRITSREEKILNTVATLGKMLSIDPPLRIEAYDISNISGTDIVAGMVVFQNGRPCKSEYKHFKIEGLQDQNDYAAMCEVITRRFKHYIEGEKGFDTKPDLVLIDGGSVHASTAVQALEQLGLSMCVFGMVKDSRHRTRALVTKDGYEVRIDSNQAVFALIGNIQEEVHRFAISYHRKLRSKRLRYSELDQIPGIGEKRKQDLLKKFQSITAIKNAELSELERLLPKNAATAVYDHFHQKES